MPASAEKDHLPRERQWIIGGDKPSVRVSHSRLRQSLWKGHFTGRAKSTAVIFFQDTEPWIACVQVAYLPRLVLLPRYEHVWLKQATKKKTVGIKPWNSSPSQLCTSNISGDLWSHMPFTVKALTGDFACLCGSAAPVSRLCDWNLVWDQLNRRDRHVFLSPRGGNHWKELTRAEISERVQLQVICQRWEWEGKKGEKTEDFTGGASRMWNGCRRT